MLSLWNRLVDLLRTSRLPAWRYFKLEDDLHTALVQRADQEQRPTEEVQAEVLAAGLAQLQAADWLVSCWNSLSPREQEVAALACLGWTNPQIAGRMYLSKETVKTYMGNILFKFNLHSRQELRQALSGWDFSGWGRPR